MAYSSILGAALGAAAVIIAVLITQRATKARDQEIRLWDKRIEAYFELFGWIHDVRKLLERGRDGDAIRVPPVDSIRDILRRMLPENALEAKVQLFGSSRVQSIFSSRAETLMNLIKGDDELRRVGLGGWLYGLELLQQQLKEEMAISQRRDREGLGSKIGWHLRVLLDRLKLRKMEFYLAGKKVSFAGDDKGEGKRSVE